MKWRMKSKIDETTDGKRMAVRRAWMYIGFKKMGGQMEARMRRKDE